MSVKTVSIPGLALMFASGRRGPWNLAALAGTLATSGTPVRAPSLRVACARLVARGQLRKVMIQGTVKPGWFQGVTR